MPNSFYILKSSLLKSSSKSKAGHDISKVKIFQNPSAANPEDIFADDPMNFTASAFTTSYNMKKSATPSKKQHLYPRKMTEDELTKQAERTISKID